MKHILAIFVDRLRDGHKEKLSYCLDSQFLDVCEDELRFDSPVSVEGEAYLALSELVMHYSVSVTYHMPCSICNKDVACLLKETNIYLAQPLETIKGAIFDLADALRDTILLNVPPFVECCNGKCPDREQIVPYLKKDGEHNPFSQLGLGDTNVLEE